MPKTDKTKRYDPVAERMYILGAVRTLIQYDPEMDDPMAILDDIIDEMLIDAFRFGWVSKETQGEA